MCEFFKRLLCCSCTIRRQRLCSKLWQTAVQFVVVAVVWYIIQARYNLGEVINMQPMNTGQDACTPDFEGKTLTLSEIMSTNANVIVPSSGPQPQYLSVEVLVRDLTQGTLVSYRAGTPVIHAGGVERVKADDDYAGHDDIPAYPGSDGGSSNDSPAKPNPNPNPMAHQDSNDNGNKDTADLHVLGAPAEPAAHQASGGTTPDTGGQFQAILNQMNAGLAGNPAALPGSVNPAPGTGGLASALGLGSSGGQGSHGQGSLGGQGSMSQGPGAGGAQQQQQGVGMTQTEHGQLSGINGMSGQLSGQPGNQQLGQESHNSGQESHNSGHESHNSGQESQISGQESQISGPGNPLQAAMLGGPGSDGQPDIPRDELGPVVTDGLNERLMTFKMELYGKASDTIEADVSSYLLASPHVCAGSPDVTLLFLIHAQPQSDDRRTAIRDTFVKPGLFQDARIAYVFLVGRTNSPNFQHALESEHGRFADIVQGDFMDKDNSSRKAVMGLHWAHRHCAGAKYVMKIDEDVFVDSDKLLHGLIPAIQGAVGHRSILCYLTTDAPVPRSGPRAFSKELFPHSHTLRPHCKAFAVLMTRGVVSSLLATARHAPYVSSEDLYIFGVLPYLAGHIEVYDVGQKRAFHDFGQETVNCYRERGVMCPLVASKAFSSRFTDLWQFVQERMTSQHDWAAGVWDVPGFKSSF